jgi:C-terminal processing protease CtpA/Prc
MSRHGRTVAALVFGCALLAGCGGGSRGQPTGGIHAKLAYSEGGGLRVVEAPAGGGADLAGIQANDVIIAINGTSVRELDYQTIVDRLRGPVGSTVQLDVFRKGEVSTVAVMRQAYTK